jgi:hypothetical protein
VLPLRTASAVRNLVSAAATDAIECLGVAQRYPQCDKSPTTDEGLAHHKRLT